MKMRPSAASQSRTTAEAIARSYSSVCLLSINDSPYDHRAIQHEPSDAWQVDVLIPPPYAEEQPQDCRNEIGGPRENGNASCIVTDPYSHDLWDSHQHSENRHGAQQAP